MFSLFGMNIILDMHVTWNIVISSVLLCLYSISLVIQLMLSVLAQCFCACFTYDHDCDGLLSFQLLLNLLLDDSVGSDGAVVLVIRN